MHRLCSKRRDNTHTGTETYQREGKPSAVSAFGGRKGGRPVAAAMRIPEASLPSSSVGRVRPCAKWQSREAYEGASSSV